MPRDVSAAESDEVADGVCDECAEDERHNDAGDGKPGRDENRRKRGGGNGEKQIEADEQCDQKNAEVAEVLDELARRSVALHIIGKKKRPDKRRGDEQYDAEYLQYSCSHAAIVALSSCVGGREPYTGNFKKARRRYIVCDMGVW